MERSTDRTAWTAIPDTTPSYTPTAGDLQSYLQVTATYTDPFGAANTATATSQAAVTTGQTTTYTDVEADGAHTAAINALAAQGLLVDTECGAATFCPDEPIKRWTMAVWLIRMDGTDPPVTGTSRFHDIEGHEWWNRYVEELADRRITLGCSTNPPLYCPDDEVTRAQMASFLTRALDLPPAETPPGSPTPKATPTPPTSTPSTPPASPSDAPPNPSDTAPTTPSPEPRWQPSSTEPWVCSGSWLVARGLWLVARGSWPEDGGRTSPPPTVHRPPPSTTSRTTDNGQRTTGVDQKTRAWSHKS